MNYRARGGSVFIGTELSVLSFGYCRRCYTDRPNNLKLSCSSSSSYPNSWEERWTLPRCRFCGPNYSWNKVRPPSPPANCGDILWCLRFCNKYSLAPCGHGLLLLTAYLWKCSHFKFCPLLFNSIIVSIAQLSILCLTVTVSLCVPACIRSGLCVLTRQPRNVQRRWKFTTGSIENKFFKRRSRPFTPEECPCRLIRLNGN